MALLRHLARFEMSEGSAEDASAVGTSRAVRDPESRSQLLHRRGDQMRALRERFNRSHDMAPAFLALLRSQLLLCESVSQPPASEMFAAIPQTLGVILTRLGWQDEHCDVLLLSLLQDAEDPRLLFPVLVSAAIGGPRREGMVAHLETEDASHRTALVHLVARAARLDPLAVCCLLPAQALKDELTLALLSFSTKASLTPVDDDAEVALRKRVSSLLDLLDACLAHHGCDESTFRYLLSQGLDVALVGSAKELCECMPDRHHTPASSSPDPKGCVESLRHGDPLLTLHYAHW